MAKRRPAKLRRPLRADEFIVYRDRKGRKRKFRSDLLLTAEVWSRKTNRKTHYVLNPIDKKSRKVVPKRFTPTRRAFIETPMGEFTARPFRKMRFTVRTTNFVIDQIPDRLIRDVNREVRKKPPVILTVRTDFPDGIFSVSDDLILEHPIMRDQLAALIAIRIVNSAREVLMRMSPKQFARNDREGRWKQPKKATVTVILSRREKRRVSNAKKKTKKRRK